MDGAATPPVAMPPATVLRARSVAADKAEAGRILTVGMANGGRLSNEDHTQLAWLVAQNTPLSLGAAQGAGHRGRSAHPSRRSGGGGNRAQDRGLCRVCGRRSRCLFGAVIAAFAAISARWEEDRETGLLPGTRVETVRL